MFNTLFNQSHSHTQWQKIPWGDPDFSRRMLQEHLTQAHDLASRKFVTIDRHIAWMHHKILNEQPANILDLGCGPGFYTGRLSERGHTCTGIDISPASIAYAREHHSTADYIQGDVRDLDFGDGYGLVSMIYGELNAFSPDDAQAIIDKAYTALKPGGKLLLEVHPFSFIHQIGQGGKTWYMAECGLFSDEPYVCLEEHRMEVDHAVSDYYVFDATSGEMTQYTTMHQAYTDDEYRHLLGQFERVTFYPSLSGSAETDNLFVIVVAK